MMNIGVSDNSDEATHSEEMAKSIKAIDKTTVHRICSGQVVLTLATAVKELVENSIDAGATSVEVRLRDHGISLLEVCDNGKGVEVDDFEGLTLKHHTSKLRDFGDLVGVKTFGFRGEALSSLCALSSLTIITRHASQAVGTKLTYDFNGKLISKSPVARLVGTTVFLQNLFSTLPVRHKEFQRNIKKEFAKMAQVLYSYCLISTGVRITCTNQLENGKKTVVVSTNGHDSVKENISSVFGAKQVSSLLEFKQESASEEVLAEYGMPASELLQENIFFSIEGHISSCAHGQGRSSADRQFYFINSRPCDPAKVSKIVNEVYHQYNRHQSPFVVLNLRLKDEDVDINVTPDKRQILVNNEKILLATIKTSMIRLYENIPSTYSAQNTTLHSSQNLSFEASPRSSNTSFASKNDSPNSVRISALTLKFGRSVAGSPLSSSPRSPHSSPLPLGLKRSYSQNSENTTTSNNKQRKLDSFFSNISQNDSCDSTPSSQSDSVLFASAETLLEGVEEFSDGNSFIESSQEAAFSDKENKGRGGNILTDGNDAAALLLDENGEKSDGLGFAERDATAVASTEQKDNGFSNEHGNNNKESYTENSKVENILDNNNTIVLSKFSCSAAPNDTGNNLITNGSSSNQGNYDKSILSRFSCPKVTPLPSCITAHAATNQFLSKLMAKKSDRGKTVKNTKFPENTEDNIMNFTSGEASGEKDTEYVASEDAVKLDEKKNKIVMCEEYDPDDYVNNRKTKHLSFSLDYLKMKLNTSRQTEDGEGLSHKFHAKIAPNDNKSAEDELRKEISKDMFSKMEILGQFNLGFIIVRLGTDLFIIDQHATDEKYNFETLQQTCVLQNQRLIIPQVLELTAVNESVLLDNIEIFRKNGFEFKVDEEKSVGRRISLISMPFSRGWEFGKEDIDELIFMLSDAPGIMCRPSRVRAMFASRACRKSVMIGTALTVSQMEKLVLHMGEIEQPWNCPHGRPTMRHLINLGMISSPASDGTMIE